MCLQLVECMNDGRAEQKAKSCVAATSDYCRASERVCLYSTTFPEFLYRKLSSVESSFQTELWSDVFFYELTPMYSTLRRASYDKRRMSWPS